MSKSKFPSVKPLTDWEGLFEEFNSESPRGCIILSAVFLDELLRELICQYLVENTQMDDLLGSDKKTDRPLSSFGARIRVAYCLGLINKEQFDDLKCVQELRNAFAHKLHGLSINDAYVISICNRLNSAHIVFHEESKIEDTPFNRYKVSVALLAQQLAIMKFNIEKKRLVSLVG